MAVKKPLAMSFSDFQKRCRILKPERFTYNNHDSICRIETIDEVARMGETHFLLFFDSIIFAWTPDRICLKGEIGTVTFSNFDSITVIEHTFYDLVYLKCETTGNQYCFMMDY